MDAMALNDLKKFAVFILRRYQAAWQENIALRAILKSVPMTDGSVGIPGWELALAMHLSDKEALRAANASFAPLYEKIQLLQRESDLGKLLKEVPPVGGIQ